MQNDKTKTDKKILFKVFFTSFLDFLGFGVLIPILPFLFSDNELSVFNGQYSKEQFTLLYGLVIGGYSLGAFLGTPLLGTASDRFGRRLGVDFL